MGYLVSSPCMATASDATAYASSLPAGYQILACTSTSSFVELTPQQKLDMFLEGSAVGSAVVVVWVIAWSFFILRRAL